jgi:uncharacterized membrane protein
MPNLLLVLLVSVVGFVVSHFLLSHIWRAWLAGAIGESGFQVVYSLVAIVLLLAILISYHFSPHGPTLWSSLNLPLQVVFDVVGYFAVVLFLASLNSNPALVGANLNGLSTRSPDGAFRVTRHPMMFAIAIFSSAQLLIMPSLRNLISCGGFIILALLGSRLQDRKKLVQVPREWGLWVSRTRFWPDLRQVGDLGGVWFFAVVPWLLITWLEVRTTLVPVGIWYFFPDLPY